MVVTVRHLLAAMIVSLLYVGPSSANLLPPLRVNWDAIGLVETRTSLCTGTLVAARIVLTAAHCVFDDKSRRERVLSFRAAWGPNGPTIESGIRRVIVPREFEPRKFQKSTEVDRYDYAFLVLAKPLGRRTGLIGMRPVERVRADSFLIEAGFGESSLLRPAGPENLVATIGCGILTVFRELIFSNDCLVVSGNSGGPILARVGRRMLLVGISSYALDGVEYSVSASAFMGAFRDLSREIGMPPVS